MNHLFINLNFPIMVTEKSKMSGYHQYKSQGNLIDIFLSMEKIRKNLNQRWN